ncbi:hypothetical protein B0O99DRAFT_623992 [Bisporella sp. PMI_857]|nr:hypothetical protein B0O99DRAFT_623992 [Bisporella sp. PMI_857]
MIILPSYRAILALHFDDENTVSAISVTLQLGGLQPKARNPLLTLLLNNGPTPTLQYDDDALSATDDAGKLPLSYSDTEEADARRTWSAFRDPVGEIVVRFVAEPRKTDVNTPVGPRIDLRTDQGGVFGGGQGFLPYPPSDEPWDVQIDWIIPDSAPAGTRVACSLGDGLKNVVTGRPKDVIAGSAFAAGPLQRWPPWSSERVQSLAKQTRQEFAIYWIGDLPYDISRTAPLTKSLFKSIASFFGDAVNPFRVFIRRVWAGHGGTGAYQAFLMEYSPGTEEEQSEDGLADFLAHEIVHEYPLLTPELADDGWYNEGGANYYACIAPFEGGAVDKSYLVKHLNNNAQAYYTSSTIDMEWKYVVDHFWDTFELTKTPYNRGFIYLAQLQGLISRATNGKLGIDSIVLELYRRQISHQANNSKVFYSLLASIIGKDETEKRRKAMENGSLIVPPHDCLEKYGLKLVRQDVEKFEPGFDSNSLRKKIITGLVKGSRAEQAGLKEGDKVVTSWMLWTAGDALENMMQVTVLRNGQEVKIKYWPRSFEKVETWKWVET